MSLNLYNLLWTWSCACEVQERAFFLWQEVATWRFRRKKRRISLTGRCWAATLEPWSREFRRESISYVLLPTSNLLSQFCPSLLSIRNRPVCKCHLKRSVKSYLLNIDLLQQSQKPVLQFMKILILSDKPLKIGIKHTNKVYCWQAENKHIIKCYFNLIELHGIFIS